MSTVILAMSSALLLAGCGYNYQPCPVADGDSAFEDEAGSCQVGREWRNSLRMEN